MTLKLTYKPDIGIIINDIALNWGTERESIRRLLNNKHQASDVIFPVKPNEFANSQRRDVYKDYVDLDTFFFLNYDDNNLLRDVEVHYGLDIIVSNVLLSFERQLPDIIKDLKAVSPSVIELGEGEYLFKALKLTIADANAMGSDGDELAYFYCSVNVDHLIELD